MKGQQTETGTVTQGCLQIHGLPKSEICSHHKVFKKSSTQNELRSQASMGQKGADQAVSTCLITCQFMLARQRPQTPPTGSHLHLYFFGQLGACMSPEAANHLSSSKLCMALHPVARHRTNSLPGDKLCVHKCYVSGKSLRVSTEVNSTPCVCISVFTLCYWRE